MSRTALILSFVEGLTILLLAGSAQAQQVPNPMSNDATNATLPQARRNLELGGVKTEGVDATTKFFTWDLTHTMFQVAASPDANEWAVEQAGLTGYGATRLCYSDTSLTVNCNYVALSKTGRHVFGNGAGKLLQLGYTGTGPITSFPMMYAADDLIVRLYAESDGYPDVAIHLKAKGVADVTLGNDATANFVRFTPSGMRLNAQTVAALPACSAANKYALAAVSDQNGAPTYRGALTGGGGVAVLAFCNGAAWEAH